MRSGYFDADGQNAEAIAHAVELAKALPWQDRKSFKKKNTNNNNNGEGNHQNDKFSQSRKGSKKGGKASQKGGKVFKQPGNGEDTSVGVNNDNNNINNNDTADSISIEKRRRRGGCKQQTNNTIKRSKDDPAEDYGMGELPFPAPI